MAPVRTCVGCRTARPADELIRIVRLEGGALSADRHGPGRGAWLCRGSVGCLEGALRRHSFERAFRSRVTPEDVAGLSAALRATERTPRPDVRG